MKIIDGKKHYTAKEIGMLVNRTHLTVHLWDTWSNELAERGDKRLIPEPIKIGKQKTRYWSETDVSLIESFAKNIQRGDLAEFSQRQWGNKADNTVKKRNHISDKKAIKSIDAKKELNLQEKLLYSLIFFLDKCQEGQSVNVETLQKHIRFDKKAIEEGLETLINLSLIGKTEDKYLLL
ncbi:hypothetical protein PP175_27605 (plasmid) [Aneurinibacillus sp. Ricciae_BoGa-3]|uniref:hypothetical protein n=1 Tax=Aneurinibacillus sp. Ricciae_BoGa-3 TaxID=3022697 RepID=UPI002341CABC|nr:hypothetical protein [Aneurinibacillus sp. Ricciae_BoGa-3]WCK56960.1 hypothetical protein PP175_27605 [Aneurinibacillus sp. Ricciae_BoGa-3]